MSAIQQSILSNLEHVRLRDINMPTIRSVSGRLYLVTRIDVMIVIDINWCFQSIDT